jgi:predicted ester cyclase
LYELMTMGDLDAIRELLAPNFVDHGVFPGEDDPGPEDYVRWNAAIHDAYSDVRYLIEDHMAAEGDRVVSHLRITRTHDRGEFAGFPPRARSMICRASSSTA